MVKKYLLHTFFGLEIEFRIESSLIISCVHLLPRQPAVNSLRGGPVLLSRLTHDGT